MERCQKVFIELSEDARIPYGDVVYKGYTRDGVYVSFVFPSPRCVLTPSSVIILSKSARIRERELKQNIVLEVEYSDGKKKKLVYPKKIYIELRKLYLEPLQRGEKPFSTGVIFAGAPGVGKSALARLLSSHLGLPTYFIDPSIQSKWVGESEKRLKETINEARTTAPAIIILDEADWILGERTLSDETGEYRVLYNMKNLLLQTMQEITDNDEHVLFIATTNKKVETLDPAFRRPGRFGTTLFFPLPDYEAVYEVLKDIVDEPTAVRLSRLSVNAGLNMDEAIGLAKRVRAGLEPEIKNMGGRGYRRIYVNIVEGFDRVFKYLPEEALNKRSRIYFPVQDDVGLAVFAQILYSANKTVVHIIDPKYFTEAVHMANTVGSAIIVSSILDPHVHYYIHNNAEVPVIYIGDIPPKAVPYYTFYPLRVLKRIIGVKPIVESVIEMYNVELQGDREKLMKKIENSSIDDDIFENILEAMVTLGVVNEKILDNMKKK